MHAKFMHGVHKWEIVGQVILPWASNKINCHALTQRIRLEYEGHSFHDLFFYTVWTQVTQLGGTAGQAIRILHSEVETIDLVELETLGSLCPSEHSPEAVL